MSLRPEHVAEAETVQFAAARAAQAQVRLIAGPGSGKSSTIEERIRWLLESGVDPLQIAVVSFTNASVIDLQLRLRAHCERHHQAGIDQVSITTLHSLALRLFRQAGLLEMYSTRPLVLDDWELENVYDAEFGEDRGIASRPRREKIRRFYEALWSTGVPNPATSWHRIRRSAMRNVSTLKCFIGNLPATTPEVRGFPGSATESA